MATVRVRIRLQGKHEDVAKIKEQLEASLRATRFMGTISWGEEIQDFTKRWAKTPNVPTNKIRVYGVIKW